MNHQVSGAYHPESQGALERFPQILKYMPRAYCLEHVPEWDEDISLVLFAIRETAGVPEVQPCRVDFWPQSGDL